MDVKEENVKERRTTCIVRKPQDFNIRIRRDIGKALNNKYKDLVFRNVRHTVGGSILIEFHDENVADKMMVELEKKLFVGNGGLFHYNSKHTAGILKQVERI